VPISVATGAGGFILPNDRVDIVLTRDMQVVDGQTTRQRTVSDVVIENVRVLAVDQTFAETAETRTVVGSTALLELSSADIATLQVADKLGDISLTLRSLADTAGPTVARADIDAMRQASGVAAAPPPAAPAAGAPAPASPPAVRVYRGGGSAAS
jgi:pilus assembly protein CpaB